MLMISCEHIATYNITVLKISLKVNIFFNLYTL